MNGHYVAACRTRYNQQPPGSPQAVEAANEYLAAVREFAERVVA